jgi:hypothetical protein
LSLLLPDGAYWPFGWHIFRGNVVYVLIVSLFTWCVLIKRLWWVYRCLSSLLATSSLPDISYSIGLPNNSYKPITNTAWVRARLYKLQKGCTRLTTASDKVYQLLAHGRWFSPGTLASSTTKTGRRDIDEILLKVALNTKIQFNSIQLPQ